MEPGDCLIHHSFAVHGAPGISTQAERRRAYATRWFGEDVRFDPRPGTSMLIDLLIFQIRLDCRGHFKSTAILYLKQYCCTRHCVMYRITMYMSIQRWLKLPLSWIWEIVPF